MHHGIFDSHAHYDSERFDPDRDIILGGLNEKGVSFVMNAASDLKASKKGIALAEAYAFVYCAVGVHPHEAAEAPANYLLELEKLVEHPKVRAVGEIGLDYHYDFSPRDVQLRVFEEQLAFAVDSGMPVIVHDREAHADTMKLLKKYKPAGVVHCFSGSAEMAEDIVRLGMYIGFTGVVTFGNARRALEAVDVIPAGRLLIETDCPYMAPEPFRGKRCDSSMLGRTAEAIAARKGMDTQSIIDITSENARTLFEI